MRKSWLLCVLLGTLAWGQAAPGTPPPAPAGRVPMAPAKPMAPPQTPDTSASVKPNAAVITIDGVCPAQPKPAAAKGAAAKPVTKAKSADCKTIITKAEFEKLANGIVPHITPQQKRQLANILPRLIAMSTQAKEQGLEKSERYAETLKYAKMQILTNELQRSIQDKAEKVPEAEIEKYYKEHPEAFEQFNLDRLFVPRTKQMENDDKDDDDKDKNEKLTDEQKKAKEAEEKAKADAAEAAMVKLADDLRARAVAGEDFVKLQKEAFEAAGMKIESPTVNLPNVRRNRLPPAHAAVFDLKAGDVSAVINDSGGHYIYKVVSKDEQSLDQVKEEIHTTLQNQRSREMMEKLNGSFHAENNPAYFGAAAEARPPMRMQNPRMVPGPTAPQQQGPRGISQPPAAQPQSPPPAQPPAAKPN